MIEYRETCDGIAEDQLKGFFVGWAAAPKPEAHLRLLRGSGHVVLAIDAGRVVGFVTAITDGVLTAYIPYLEVLPEWQDKGVGSELMRRMLARLGGLYAVDLLCDPGLEPYYERFRMIPAHGMILRRYDRQGGMPAPAPSSLAERLLGWLRRKKERF